MCKKFTLIELLVVVAIIGILSSILMPSLSKARAKGLQAVCLSNAKQSHLAVTMYASESNGWGPKEIGSGNGQKWYDKLIPDYLPEGEFNFGSSPATRCPSAKTITGAGQSTIALNAFISGKDVANTAWVAQQTSMFAATEPDQTSVFIDSYDTWRSLGFAHTTAEFVLNDDLKVRIARHLEKANVAYIDGHAKSISALELISKNIQNDVFWNPAQ